MEIIKLNIITFNDWLEATWSNEVTTINEVEKDGEIVREESITTEQIHCESFSGHREHIQMLRAKALEFGTSLDGYEYLIKQCEDNFVYPTDEELAKNELNNKIQEANSYLSSTDWVKDYKLRHDLGLELISEASSKWEILNKRTEYTTYLKGI